MGTAALPSISSRHSIFALGPKGPFFFFFFYYMTGAPEGSPKVVFFFMWFYGFMEKPGIEPATPGLQGIALIHYTTGKVLGQIRRDQANMLANAVVAMY